MDGRYLRAHHEIHQSEVNQTPTTKSAGGFKLQEFGKGRNAIQSKYANELVRALNKLGRIRIVRGKTDMVFYSDNEVTIQLRDTAATTDTGETVDVTVCVDGVEQTYRLRGTLLA